MGENRAGFFSASDLAINLGGADNFRSELSLALTPIPHCPVIRFLSRSLPHRLRLVCAAGTFISAVNPALHGDEYRWDTVKIGGGGFVSAVVTSAGDEDLLYARTDVGGAYRWNAEGESWIPLTDWVSADELGFLGVESLAIDPQAPNRLYLLVGTSYFNGGRTAILRSNDAGETFEVTDVTAQFKTHGNGMGRQNGERLQVDPNNSGILYCGTRWDGLFRSADAGITWERIDALAVTGTPNETGISFVVLDPTSGQDGETQTLCVGISRFGENLYRSDDGGETFFAIEGAPTAYLPQRAALAGNGDLYITYGDGSGPHGHWDAALGEPMASGQVWRYSLSTGSWANVTPPGESGAFGGISVDPENPERLVLSTLNQWRLQNPETFSYGDRIFLTINGGTSWIDVIERGFGLDPNGVSWISDQAIHWAGSIEFDPSDSKRVWVTSGNGVFRTDDIDAADCVWTFMVPGLEETVPLDLVSVPGGPLVSVIGDYDGFVHDDVRADPIRHSPARGTSTSLAVAAKNPDRMLRVVESEIHYSTNGGSSWNVSERMEGSFGTVAISADGSVFLHAPEGDSRMFRSTDQGDSWAEVPGVAVNGARPVADPMNADKFYLHDRAEGRMYRSTDKGVTFSEAGLLAPWGSPRISVAPEREGDLWVPLYNGGLARSNDSGSTFVVLPGVTHCEAVGHGVAAAGAEYPAIYIWGTVGGIRGLHRSTDEGATWVRVNDDAHQYGGPANGGFVVGDRNVFGRVYMSTAGRGIVYGDPLDPEERWEHWRIEHFSEEEREEGTVAAWNADPDKDGLVNRLEWMLGTDPREPDVVGPVVFERTGEDITVVITSRTASDAAGLRVEVSVDLKNWGDVEEVLDRLDLESSGGWKTDRFFAGAGMTPEESLFLRLIVSQP